MNGFTIWAILGIVGVISLTIFAFIVESITLMPTLSIINAFTGFVYLLRDLFTISNLPLGTALIVIIGFISSLIFGFIGASCLMICALMPLVYVEAQWK